MHFLHANGYPPACYEPLLGRLRTEYHAFGMLLRPLWPGTDPDSIRDWRPFSEDLRHLLRSAGTSPVIGLGHSIGAVTTLRAALQEPRLFSALVLMDPVLLPPLRILQLQAMHMLGLHRGNSRLVRAALNRRRHFDDLEQLFAGYRRRQIFRFFSDESLRALVNGLTRSSPDGGYDLVYSPEWEARIYQTGIWIDWDLWNGIAGLKVPMLFLRGAETDTFFVRTAEMARRRNSRIRVETVANATHLLPLEKPDEVFEATRRFLQREGIG